MNPSRLFIARPIATSLLMIAIMLAGIVAYRQLPISALPQVDYPTIQVVTLYPGASPEVMTTSVTAPMEKQFGQIPGLNQMSSTSSGGASVITLQFNLDLGIDIAEQEVQAAINAGANLLPTDLPTPPIYSKVNPADAPILTLGITSSTMPLSRAQDLIDTRLAQKLSQLPGVGLVSLSGGQKPAIRIQANPGAVAAMDISLDDLRAAIANANTSQAKGSFDGPARASTIDANDQLKSADEYKNLIVAYKNGAPVRLIDVADVIDGTENRKLAAWANDKPAVILNIQRQSGANVIEVVNSIKELLPKLQASLPASLEVKTLTDRTVTIRASVSDVQFELMLAIVLVVLVIFLFLRNIPATIIPSVAVPVSLVGTFGFMYMAGFSINNLTLMALTIATGFVVDDAIVMIENIARIMEESVAEGKPLTAMQASLIGSKQIGFTIISLTFSLIAVLIPLLFMGDVVGRLFREFAITLAVSILISAVVSLTLTPMMCARLLKVVHPEDEAPFARKINAIFENIIARYAVALRWVLQRQFATLMVAIATLILTVLLYILVPKGFFPVQDTGVIQGITEASQSISFPAMMAQQEEVAKIVLQDPAVESLSSFIGVDGSNATLNAGRMLINLKPESERELHVSDVIRRIKSNVSKLRGVSLYMQPVQDLTIEDRISRTQYQFTLQDTDAKVLSTWTQKLVERLQQIPELADVASDAQDQGLQAFVEIDRDAASRLGVTPATIDTALYNAFGQRLISTIYTQASQYRVVLEVKPEFQLNPKSLENLYVTSQISGQPAQQIPLSSIARVVEKNTSLVINHIAQFPSSTISFNLAPGSSLGEAVKVIKAAEQEIGLPLTVQTSFQGAALAFQASLTNTLLLILAAIITMYIVLGVLYESTIHPVTILSTLPSAGVGALLALILSRTELSIIAIIGIILLIGIVKKNAIMMIDFALDAERSEGKSPEDAIYQACLLRFRPILMTTMAALLGALPLMLGTGVGSELRHPLGITMVGGLLVSQVLTLFTTPVIYLYFDRLARRFGMHSGEQIDAGEEDESVLDDETGFDDASPSSRPA